MAYVCWHSQFGSELTLNTADPCQKTFNTADPCQKNIKYCMSKIFQSFAHSFVKFVFLIRIT